MNYHETTQSSEHESTHAVDRALFELSSGQLDEPVLPKSTKGTGEKFDDGKPKYSLIPPIALKGMAEILTFGADKYGAESWKLVPNREERYLNALYRHLEAYRSGEKLDQETFKSHLSHVLCNAAFLLHFEEGE